MRRFLFVAGSAVLAWQALVGVLGLWSATCQRAGVPWHVRLAATTDERIRRVLGERTETLLGLRALPAGTLLLCQKVVGRILDSRTAADFERLNARNVLLLQLEHLLYPSPVLLPVPQPIEAVEQQVRLGRQVSLCVLPGDPTPEARRGWTRTLDTPRFQQWQFRMD